MNSTILENLQSRVADTAGCWVEATFSALPEFPVPPDSLTRSASSSPWLLLSVISMVIWRVVSFVLASCNRTEELAAAHTGSLHGVITLTAYAFVVRAAGRWAFGKLRPMILPSKRGGLSSRKPLTKAMAGRGNIIKNSAESEKGVVAMCYTNAVFDHAKAAKFIEEIDEAMKMNRVLAHLMNSDLQESLQGIRANTPMREFQTTVNTIRRKTGELAGF